jgi:hypothetical protein
MLDIIELGRFEMISRNASALAAMAASDTPVQPADARQDRRRQLLWSGVLQTARGPAQCTVVDISHGGARVSVASAVERGQAVTLVVTGLGMYRGTVVWSEGGAIGIEFAQDPGTARV